MAKPATLDRTRSFAEVHPAEVVFYHQDHKAFDHNGIEVLANGEDAASAEDYDDWPWKILVKELKMRTGKGPTGMKRPEVIEALRALDAAPAQD